MGFLTRLAKRVFGAKDTTSTSSEVIQNRQRVLTIPEATKILEAYKKPLSLIVLAPWGEHVEFRRAAQFLYQKKALPDSFFALPKDTQNDIIFLGKDLTAGMIERPDRMWKLYWEKGEALNFNHWAPRSSLQVNCPDKQSPPAPRQG